MTVRPGQAEVHPANGVCGVAAGVDGVFLEIHERPGVAKSDAQNALALDLLEPLLRRLIQIHDIAHGVTHSAAVALGAGQPAR